MRRAAYVGVALVRAPVLCVPRGRNGADSRHRRGRTRGDDGTGQEPLFVRHRMSSMSSVMMRVRKLSMPAPPVEVRYTAASEAA